jgi:uncharacterized membrane protein
MTWRQIIRAILVVGTIATAFSVPFIGTGLLAVSAAAGTRLTDVLPASWQIMNRIAMFGGCAGAMLIMLVVTTVVLGSVLLAMGLAVDMLFAKVRKQ